MSASTPTLRIKPLATLTPPSATRAWFSAPHPTAPIVATASSDKSVRIYSLATFNLHSTVSGGHKRSVRTCAWKPGVKGESVLATGSFDASAGIWRRWEHLDGVPRVRVEDNEREIGGGREDRGSEEEDDGEDNEDDEWRFSVILDGHESEIKSVAWNAGGQYLATCSRDKTVWIWEEVDEDNFETIAVLQEHEADVKCVTWHPEEDLLASSSYDDTIRLYREDLDDWSCVAVLNGHGSTVWSIAFEPVKTPAWVGGGELSGEQKELVDGRKASGPRLISCSDDMTIRTWQRRPKERVEPPTGQGRIPSILRTNNIEEDWYEEARLPQAHDRAIYSVFWSQRSGRVVSTGSDGKVVVYEERWRQAQHPPVDGVGSGMADSKIPTSLTEWVVIAELENGHDVYEINNVCWTNRRDRGRQSDDEEMILTTGDDGEVKAWILDKY